jgi:hypothetical protein
MNKIARPILAIVGAVIIVLAVVFVFVPRYPYGARRGYAIAMALALEQFANQNGGHYPNGVNGFVAIKALFPNYIDCDVLAGLSGNREACCKVLREGKELTEASCSWVYLPGLRQTDSKDLPILWERTMSIGGNGESIGDGGRVVVFVGGRRDYVSSTEWEKIQKRLMQ